MKSQQWTSSFGPGPDGPVQVHSQKSAPPLLSKRRRRRPPCAAAAAARCLRKFVSGQLDEENPFVLILSALIVQPDEGVSVLVVDRIGDNLPQSTEKSRILVIPVGARHKCQQEYLPLATRVRLRLSQFYAAIKLQRLNSSSRPIPSTTGISIPSMFCTIKPVKISRTESSRRYGRNEFRQRRCHRQTEGGDVAASMTGGG
ncbi:hypothetical protein F511_31405 [Dorcoceras hygrometricum]|uniref:Uncharacterized protein n=1 Tax=Dorcoceras hygrometricum TaxID=472368 RepID=A0A2Z7D0P1_9LAMI|nr:hypothetical protein F511_31405 [Dorcoceras hygrometricum]